MEAAIDLLAPGTSSSGALHVARKVVAHLSQCADIWHPETIPADETITGRSGQMTSFAVRAPSVYCPHQLLFDISSFKRDTLFTHTLCLGQTSCKL